MKIQINALTDLTYDNYLELTDYIDNSNFELEFFSPIALISWLNYNFKVKFNILKQENVILFYLSNSSQWGLSTCFYNKNINLSKTYEQIKSDLFLLNNNDGIIYNNISINMINDWNIDPNTVYEIGYTSNYIYELDKFKTYAGRKLQKKRNHLNNFLKQNYNLSNKLIKEVSVDELLNFSLEHIKRYQDKFNEDEYNVYKRFLGIEQYKSNNYVGLVSYIDNKIIGYTLCYLRKNICEVIIEKADRDYLGSYQYLIQQNLLINNINQYYMDRQDDNFSPALKKSKQSYYPMYEIKRYSSKV